MQEKLKNIIDELKTAGVETIEAIFTGGGYEGAIDEIDFQPVSPREGQRDDLENALYDYLNDKGDWNNNEGGGGTVEIDVLAGKISCDMYFNETHHIILYPRIETPAFKPEKKKQKFRYEITISRK